MQNPKISSSSLCSLMISLVSTATVSNGFMQEVLLQLLNLKA
jgi:hypothetical protein